MCPFIEKKYAILYLDNTEGPFPGLVLLRIAILGELT